MKNARLSEIQIMSLNKWPITLKFPNSATDIVIEEGISQSYIFIAKAKFFLL